MKGIAAPPLGAIDVLRLPCMPTVLHRAVESAANPRTLGQLILSIGMDPGLAARVASTWAGETRKPFSLARHIERMGSGLAQSVLMRATTDRLYRATRLPETPDGLALWAHALHTAQSARHIAEACGYAHPDEAYLAGLFHDIGILALATDLPYTYADIFRTARDEAELVEAELDHLQTSHMEVGAAMMGRLGMPAQICDAILLQHAGYEELAGTHKLVRILWIAETLGGGGAVRDDLKPYAGLIGVDAERLERAMRAADAAFDQCVAALRLPALPGTPMWRMPPASAVAKPGAADAAVWESAADAALMTALMQSASLHQVPALLTSAPDTASVLSRIRGITAALFGIDRYLAFMHDPASGVMVGALIAPDRIQPTDLEIPLSAGASLIARAAAENRMLQSSAAGQSETLRGVDLQVSRILNARALTMIPMLASRAMLGVLVFGVGDERAPRLPLDAQMLRRLTEITSRVLADRKIDAQQRRDREGELREGFRNSTRRLVHEARNPLTVMKTQLELLGERAREGQPIEHHLLVLRQEIERVTEIVSKIGTADLVVDSVRAAVDVNEVVREMMSTYCDALFYSRSIAVDLDLDGRSPRAIASVGAIKQILLNLWKNASEALGSGGKLRVRTVDRVNYEGNLMVEVSVSDTGRGMPPEIVENMFSRQLSTAGSGDRGFGLSNALMLVKQLAGHLLCRSEPDVGTTFILLLPRASTG